jgi:hypothetical protein
LPDLVRRSPDAGIIIHELAYRELNSFQQPVETLAQQKKTDPFRYNCLKLSYHENALNVLLEWERSEGVPRRHTLPRTGFSVQNGQWGRVMYNLRAAWEGHWIYKKYVLNIGLFPLPSPEIFLESVPVHTYQDMAQLH